MATSNTATDPELPVEEVAERLGLPVGMLVRRIEAGDIPARRGESGAEADYRLRLSDLGITPEEAAIFHGNQVAARGRGDDPSMDLTGRSSRAPTDALSSSDSGAEAGADAALPGTSQGAPSRSPGASVPAAAAAAAGSEITLDQIVPPPPSRGAARVMSIVDPLDGPRAELASMSIDPRELVAGLLDRWERTLEQRIYAEQRQRFEAELNSRMHQVKELSMELQAARAEHAAAQAEKDLILAGKERDLADRDRSLSDERSRSKRRRWFSRV